MFDVGLIQWLQSFSTPWLDRVAVAITHLGSHYAYMVILLSLYWCVDRQVARRVTGLVLASLWFNGLIKEYFTMPRPDPALVRHLVTEPSPGFPSGHAQGSVALWGYLAVAFRRRWLTWVCVLLILLIGVSRLYAGVHFPGDVLGGWVIGAVFLIAFHMLVRSGVVTGLSVRLRMLLALVVPLLLFPLYQTSSVEQILGIFIGMFTAELLAADIAPFRERVPVGQQILKLLIGYAGFAVLFVLHMLYVPVGLPSVLGYSIMALWVVLGAPLVFRRLGLAGGAPAPRPDATTRRYVRHYTATVAVVLLLVVASTLYVQRAVPVVARPALLQGDRVLVIAHRGGAGIAPENTLAAVAAAVALNVDLVEIDVQRTRDGVLVLMRDATVERTTNGTGPVSAMTLEEIQQLDAGYHFTSDGGRTYPWRGRGVTVPTLAETLAAFPEARFIVDIREGGPGIAQAVLATIDEAGARQRVMIASEIDEVLHEVRRLAPDLPTTYGMNEMRRVVYLQKLGLGAFVPPVADALQTLEWWGRLRVATVGLQRLLRDQGVNLHVGIINDEEDMYRMIGLGANGIATDYPDRLEQVLATLGERNLDGVIY